MPILGVPDAAFTAKFVEEVGRFRVANVGRPSRFSFLPFLSALLSEFLHPYSLIVLLPAVGWRGVTNRLLLPQHSDLYSRKSQRLLWPIFADLFTYETSYARIIFFNGITRMAVHILVVICAARNSSSYHYIWPMVLTAELLSLLKTSVIALKYGFMTPRERHVVNHASFHVAWRTLSQMQVLSTYFRVSTAYLIVEVERLCAFTLRPFGLEPELAHFRISSAAAAHLRSRLMSDVARLNIEDADRDHLQRLLSCEDGRCSVAALVLLTRLASQPKKGVAAKMLRAGKPMATLFALLLAALAFMAPALVPTGHDDGEQQRLAFLRPVCSCELACDKACGCVQLDPLSAAIIVLTAHLARGTFETIHKFVGACWLEAIRRFRTIRIWGKLLLAGPMAWPLSKSGGASASSGGGAPNGGDHHQHSSPPPQAFPSQPQARSHLVTVEMVSSASERKSGRHRLPSTAQQDKDDDDDDEEDEVAGCSNAMLRAVVADPTRPLTDHVIERLPTVSLRDAQSVYGWEVGRQMLIDFGERIRVRMAAYFSIFLSMVFILVFLQIGLLYGTLEQPERLPLQLLFASMVCVTFLAIPLTSTLLILVAANELNPLQRKYLSLMAIGLKHKLAARGPLSPPTTPRTEETGADTKPTELGGWDDAARWDDDDAREREEAAEAIGQAQEKLAEDHETQPFQILGFPATFGFVSSLLSLGALSASVLGGLVVNSIRAHYEHFDLQFVNLTNAAISNGTTSCG
jgi:hypothetical protein